MDILAALESSHGTTRAEGRCKLGKTLDSIADNAEGKEALLAAVDDATGAWSGMRLAVVFANLGMPVSASGIVLHRRHRCACYGVRS